MGDSLAMWRARDEPDWMVFPRVLLAASLASQHVFVICAFHYLDLWCPAKSTPSERFEFMDDIERDGDITINVGFGNITFGRGEGGTFTQTVIDLTADNRPHDRIELAIRVAVSHHDPLIDIVEQNRRHVIDLLQAATDKMKAETAETLLYATSHEIANPHVAKTVS